MTNQPMPEGSRSGSTPVPQPVELSLGKALGPRIHHDDIPGVSPRLKPLEHRLEDQQNFLGALRASRNLLAQSGVQNTDYMVMAGGSVFLHELAEGASFDAARAPTDLDFVIRNDEWNSRVASALLNGLPGEEQETFVGLRRITETRTHFGYRFPNAVIEARVGPTAGISDLYDRGRTHFDIDFIPGHMVTIFPDSHPFPELRGVSFQFPTEERKLFERGRLLDLDKALAPHSCRFSGGIGEVRVAHPAFTAFYKITMMRDVNGKQDGDDLRRLHRLGLLDCKRGDFAEMMELMTKGHPDVSQRAALFDRILDTLQRVVNR